MSKALAILGIVGAVLAALLAFAVSGDFVPVLVLLFLVVCGVFLLLRRTGLTTVMGVVLILLGLSALLYYNPITGKDGAVYLAQLPAYFHGAFMPTLVLLGCVAILVAARDDVEPAWAGYLGLAAAALAIILVAFVANDQFGNFANPLGIGVAILALLLLIPLVALVRGPPATVAPVQRTTTTTATTTRTVRK
ncbi:MAG TPA: hypothetical protein VM286_06745 [Candidatus Thermoplasmatota archaeon]|nr:hypothetical protein [Candidatus Thermoplasmatota archaeon]